MISIIGAGPSGLYSALELSRYGLDAEVYEDHKEIGLPVQCTGLVTSNLLDIYKPPKDAIINIVKAAKIFAPNGRFIETKFSNPNIILDRAAFDRSLYDRCIDDGIKVHLSSRLKAIRYEKEKKTYRLSINDKNIASEKIIAADGPLSTILKKTQPDTFKNRKFWLGSQVRAKIKNDNTIHFYPYLGTYAWLVPEDEHTARIGCACTKNPNPILKSLVKRYNIKSQNIMEHQAGIIPKFQPSIKAQYNNTYLVGDAASFVKATTGGGIIQGMISARSASYSIAKDKNYNFEWKKSLLPELYLHLKVRNTFDRFSNDDWNSLIETFSDKNIISELNNTDRDNLLKLSAKLILKKPALLYYLKHIF